MPRPLNQTDLPEVQRLLDAAFAPSRFESQLVKEIMQGGDPYWAWGEDRGGELIACIVYTIACRDSQPIGYHLAPVAVAPDWQGQGVGSQLITQTLIHEPLKESAVFVLGAPIYYERFGFQPVESARCPYEPSNQHFRALRWSDSADSFTISYCDAFRLAEKSAQ